VRPVIDSANAAKPIAAFLVPEAPEALARLSEAGVPSFRTPEACADAIAAALSRRAPKPAAPTPAISDGRVLDELEAYALLDRLGVPRSPAVALDATIAQVPPCPSLSGRGEGSVRRHPAQDRSGRRRAECARRRRPGGAIKTMRATVQQRTGITPDRVLVAPMMSGIGEALIGYRVDREAGPLIMVAAGGVYHRNLPRPQPAPCAGRSADRHAMIAEVKAFATLKGFRGKPAGDLDALAKAIVALSQLALQNDPVVAEAEVNPLIVRPTAWLRSMRW
jgi:hypothetical protein